MAGIRGASDLARFILDHYSGKVVEVGSGRATEVAALLVEHLEVVATDRTELVEGGVEVVADDIFSPREELYEGASLIYSIRPPLEMQLAIGRLAQKLGANVIVRPLAEEVAHLPAFQRTLVNEGQARFYLFTPSTPRQPGSPTV